MAERYDFDVLVVGSGAAGLTLALHLPERVRIAVLAKAAASESSTLYAQGGVSAVFDSEDSVESHVNDTLDAGAGLCRPQVVREVVRQGRECIRWLDEQGVPFTREAGGNGHSSLHLTREGGHSHRRVVHAADYTGRAIQETLLREARERPNIAFFERYVAVDLVTLAKLGQVRQRCVGAYVYDRAAAQVKVFRASFVVLATGGAGKVYLYTSNPDVATGDGIALAWRAGCPVANMEFMQFHPTCLYHPHAKSFLVTEAIRGEGGRLLLPDGTRFMERFDERRELAPRDIVARAIDHEMKRLGSDHLLLDITQKPRDFLEERFPTVYAKCRELGIDMAEEPIPIVPAAHYMCGGVIADIAGRTHIEGLLAIGEVACTGLHGANRMASNSLLECLVMGRSAAREIEAALPEFVPAQEIPAWDESLVTDSDEEVVVSHNWDELRHFMWDYVGIVRTSKRLQRALSRVKLLKAEIADYYGNFKVTSDLLELRNLVLVAELIIRAALKRRESRGLHYTLDYPAPDTSRPPQDTLLTLDSIT